MNLKVKIKKIIYSILNKVGYKIIGTKKKVSNNDFDSIVKFLIQKEKEENEKIFFDVGANIGQSIKRFLELDPKARIHSFEPTPRLVEKLKEKFGNLKNITINNFALGEKFYKLFLNDYSTHRINSFNNIDEESKFHKAMSMSSKNKDNFVKKIEVNVNTIDDYCKKNKISKIDFIKIDTQGFEDKVLEGASNLISKNSIKIIELELIIGFAYEKMSSFYDIEKHLNKNNYFLIAIKDSGNIISFSIFQTNLLYVNKEIFEKIRKIHSDNLDIKDVTKKITDKYPYLY